MRNDATHGVSVGVILLALLGACGGGIADPGPGGGTPGLRIVSGSPASDTISSDVAQLLAVEVTDSTGRPAVGRFVVFDVVPAPLPATSVIYAPLSVGREGDALLRNVILDTTDSRGRAAVHVRLGTVAGAGAVRINVPELGYVDTARYTTTPGALHHIDASPLDSAAYVGRGYVVRARAADREGNLRANEPMAFSVASGPATIDAATGALTATALGRASIVVTSGTRSTTAFLSVVPRGWVASQQHFRENGGPIGVFLMELDGSGRTLLADMIAHVTEEQGFGWSPDGSDLVIARGDSVDLVAPGTPERRLIRTSGPVLLGARFSRDGAWIYFSRPRIGLSRVRRDGTGLQVIGTPNTAYEQDYRPSPSPDGQSVAYVSGRAPCGSFDNCIRVLDLATNADRSYGGRGYLVRGMNAAWSPTDDLIGYASSTEVGVIRSDGTGQRVLATDLSYVGWIEWSPDGKWLIVSPWSGPVLLFDVQTGLRIPIPTLGNYVATAWRP
jgi:hypothetical protein